MFREGIRITSLCAGICRHRSGVSAGTNQAMNRSRREQDLQDQICRMLADRLPATAEEIAASTAADTTTVAALLEDLALHSRVMFNPLTKRYSLPRVQPGSGLAA